MQKFNAERERSYQKIEQLASRFEEQKMSYLQSHYNETQTRRDFIDPFFKALGWDIDNENGYAESYREVIHEDRVKIGKTNKAPDYSFRLVGGKRLFFVEAKKPSVLIKTEEGPAFQVRRYGWSAKLPVSIITDFQEFAVYDCTKKPLLTDKAATARIKYLTYTDYINDFDFIWNTFSKQRVLEGSFDKFVQNDTYKKGTATVDHEFLQSLDSWRTQLAVSISKSNKYLDEDEINFAVQHTIDRLIFLRIAEDRSIEPYGNLKDCIKDGNLYRNLHGLFLKADEKYNSGLFDFNKDKISHHLEIDNKVIRSVINDLYFPCPYEFSVLPVEILGTAYEQFLGKQIKVDKSHRVSIEEKPAVRKAGGVYYTPQYIVEYIVKNTVGKLIEGKTPKEVSALKIVDPACGSGSFLLGAYEYLLNWHKDYYTNTGKISKGSKLDTLTPEGNLTTAEKKRILLNNIYGVDIDTNAVEVTKLSLLIKCMEGETEASIATQMRLFHDRILPTLDNNVKSGNSLIDTDYYDTELDFGDEKKIKPFNWQRNFPEVFKQGGFDAVIGNPPYFRIENDKPESQYLRTKYKTSEFKLDIYTLFLEKFATSKFKKLGFIVPNTLLNNLTDKKLRQLLISGKLINEIVNYRIPVFQDAVVHTMIVILDQTQEQNTIQFTDVSKSDTQIIEIENEKLAEANDFSLDFRMFGNGSSVIEKMKKASARLDQLCEIKQTIKTGNDPKYVTTEKTKNNYKPVIGGKEIQRYELNYNGRFVNYGKHLACPRNPEIFEVKEKILIRETGKRITATYDNEQYYILSSLYSVFLKVGLNYNIKYILGLINSNVSQYFMQKLCFDNSSGAFVKARIFHFQQLPLKTIDFKNEKELSCYNSVIKYVDELLTLKKRIKTETIPNNLGALENKADYYEDKINQLVYQLYHLTEEEIKTIEESFKD